MKRIYGGSVGLVLPPCALGVQGRGAWMRTFLWSRRGCVRRSWRRCGSRPESPGEPEEPAQAVAVAGSQWVPVAQWHRLPGGYVRQVASVDGRPLYAFVWDEAPYSVLLSPEGAGQYREYRRVH